jgi:hypothetical protein
MVWSESFPQFKQNLKEENSILESILSQMIDAMF